MADKTIETGVKQVQIQGALKGASVVVDVTASAIDADHTGLDVKVLGAALPPGAATDAELILLLGGPWTSYTSAAREKTGTVKATAGTLKSCVCSLLSTGAAGFVQAHNAATATPVATATIRFVLGPINPGDVRYYELESMAFAAGVKLAISTTEDTYTAPGTDDALWHARFS